MAAPSVAIVGRPTASSPAPVSTTVTSPAMRTQTTATEAVDQSSLTRKRHTTCRQFFGALVLVLTIVGDVWPLLFTKLNRTCGFGESFGEDLVQVPLSKSLVILWPLSVPPVCWGGIVTSLILNFESAMLKSRMNWGTYILVAFSYFLNWSFPVELLYRCTEHSDYPSILDGGEYLWPIEQMALIWLSLLTLYKLRTVSPKIGYLGQLLGCLCYPVLLVLQVLDIIAWTKDGEGRNRKLEQVLRLVLLTLTSTFYTIVVLVLRYSARAADQESHHDDIDEEGMWLLKRAATWSRRTSWSIVLVLIFYLNIQIVWFSDDFLTSFHDAMEMYENLSWGVAAVVNAVTFGLLSGIIGPQNNAQRASEIMGLTAVSVEARRRRQIERRLMIELGGSTGTALAISALMEGVSPESAMQDAIANFRCVSWEVLSRRPEIIICGGPRGASTREDDTFYSLSEPCQLGQCDMFFSHSWRDAGNLKWLALKAWCEEFTVAVGRSPRIWLDKVCISPVNIDRDLRCLPIFLAGSNTLFACCLPTYSKRMWCCMEILVYRAMLTADADRSPPVMWFVGENEAECELQRQACLAFRVSECECFDPNDKKRFLRVVQRYPGGEDSFNRFVQDLAAVSGKAFATKTGSSEYDITERV
eukprot:TRINITY_DN43064_c0_g1_i1.p1 TRINITY_DN43064_c0_g1~~TRINITY_DN43064_c0_g1_i1.p1  ORF type:complete len:670 (-),score=67.53 TRINITY_DN43064_c0_g1_i1:90-2018(-)